MARLSHTERATIERIRNELLANGPRTEPTNDKALRGLTVTMGGCTFRPFTAEEMAESDTHRARHKAGRWLQTSLPPDLTMRVGEARREELQRSFDEKIYASIAKSCEVPPSVLMGDTYEAKIPGACRPITLGAGSWWGDSAEAKAIDAWNGGALPLARITLDSAHVTMSSGQKISINDGDGFNDYGRKLAANELTSDQVGALEALLEIERPGTGCDVGYAWSGEHWIEERRETVTTSTTEAPMSVLVKPRPGRTWPWVVTAMDGREVYVRFKPTGAAEGPLHLVCGEHWRAMRATLEHIGPSTADSVECRFDWSGTGWEAQREAKVSSFTLSPIQDTNNWALEIPGMPRGFLIQAGRFTSDDAKVREALTYRQFGMLEIVLRSPMERVAMGFKWNNESGVWDDSPAPRAEADAGVVSIAECVGGHSVRYGGHLATVGENGYGPIGLSELASRVSTDRADVVGYCIRILCDTGKIGRFRWSDAEGLQPIAR